MERNGPPFGKILLVVTEDWFVLSHFKPLIRALKAVAGEVVVATRDSGRLNEIAALGVRTTNIDLARKATDPRVVLATAGRLRQLIADEKPDAVHLIALKPIVLGALALRGNDLPVGVHLTGLGHLGVATSFKGRLLRHGVFALFRSLLRRPRARLFVENEDDLQHAPVAARPSAIVLGGAGVDPEHFTAMPHRDGPPVVAYVGRLVRSKGVDVLIAAARLLKAANAPAHLRLFGAIDTANPDAYARHDIETWQHDGLASWGGHVADVRAVWQDADIAVAPSRGGEGLPRAVLEAAACGRALIVTDVPGNRRFVRDGVEGLVVPPNDPVALSKAIAALANDPARRRTMGEAGRQRILGGYTELHVEAAIAAAYRALAAAPR